MAQPILHLVSWNTNGLRSKKSEVLIKLENFKTDIAFIQETHIGPQCINVLEDIQGWRVFYTVHDSRKKGVAILIRDRVPFQYICHDEDYCGGYIVLFCHLYGELFTLANVYNHKEDKRVLCRLKDYLTETAEGVLLIGGDFNTVFNPTFDRRLSATISQFQVNLEDFTTSLRLKDTWAYLQSADEGFTYYQNDSHSRLDMLFTAEETIGRVSEIQVKSNRLEREKISNHKPIAIKFAVQAQSGNKTPYVASSLKAYTYTPDRRVGKINGAEILGAIKSFTDSGEHRPGEHDVAFYKKHRCTMTEELKVSYNQILLSNTIPGQLKTYQCFEDRYVFVCKYLIFLQILAKRLSELTTACLKEKQKNNTKIRSNNIILIVIIKKYPQEIRSSFLKKSISGLRSTNATDSELFRILRYVLPRVERKSGVFRRLRNGCPLTKPILDMVLKLLECELLKQNLKTSVCFQRQALKILGDQSRCRSAVKKFCKKSGVKVNIV